MTSHENMSLKEVGRLKSFSLTYGEMASCFGRSTCTIEMRMADEGREGF